MSTKHLIHTSESHDQPPEMSKGEKWFDRMVYTGLNYFANLGISLVAADYFTNLAGRKHLDKVIGATERGLLKTGIINATHAQRTAKGAWEVLALTGGGWIAALATKPLEDNKRPIVHWLNKKMGVDQNKADGTEATPEEIYIKYEQPKQSWFNIVKRRVIASVAIVASGHAIEYTVGKKNITDGIVSNVNKGLKSGYVPGGKKLAGNETFERYLGFAALDTIFTGIHAVTMNLTTGAKKARMPKELNDEADPAGKEIKLNEITITPEEPKPSFASKVTKLAPAESHAAGLRDRDKTFSIAT